MEIARATNMEDLKDKLKTVPVESIIYHASRNHFSAWLMARGEGTGGPGRAPHEAGRLR